jgi:hypothetical protein
MIKGLASSYGDTADMVAYQRALVTLLRAGHPQAEAEALARKVGDPGIGWADNVLSDASIPWVALPYEQWLSKWGSKSRAHKKPLLVTIRGVTHTCILGDTMPHEAHIANGAVIDLAPGAQAAFHLTAPFLVPVSWQWA